jgi:hypothetical protein
MVDFPTRRNILKRFAAISIGTLIPTPWINFLEAQKITNSKSQHMPNREFESSHIEIGDNNIYFRRYGKGPAILMVHGFPRTSLMWRHLAPKLAEDGSGKITIVLNMSNQPNQKWSYIHG